VKKTHEYVGDGVYCTLDEYGGITLTTESHIESEAGNAIYLEPKVWSDLLCIVESLRLQKEEVRE